MNEQLFEENKIISELGEYPLFYYIIQFCVITDYYGYGSFNIHFNEKIKKLLSDNKIYFELKFLSNEFNMIPSQYTELKKAYSRSTIILIQLATTEFLINSIVELLRGFIETELKCFVDVYSVEKDSWDSICTIEGGSK